jgi:hypothetical protein
VVGTPPSRVVSALGDLQAADLVGDRDRQPHHAALVCDRAADGLADPQRRVSRKAVPAAVVELLDGAHEPDRALLDEVGQRQPRVLALVALGDVHDEAQVGLDHVVFRGHVAALDAACEHLLLGRREQRRASDATQVEGQSVVVAIAHAPDFRPRCSRVAEGPLNVS